MHHRSIYRQPSVKADHRPIFFILVSLILIVSACGDNTGAESSITAEDVGHSDMDTQGSDAAEPNAIDQFETSLSYSFGQRSFPEDYLSNFKIDSISDALYSSLVRQETALKQISIDSWDVFLCLESGEEKRYTIRMFRESGLEYELVFTGLQTLGLGTGESDDGLEAIKLYYNPAVESPSGKDLPPLTIVPDAVSRESMEALADMHDFMELSAPEDAILIRKVNLDSASYWQDLFMELREFFGIQLISPSQLGEILPDGLPEQMVQVFLEEPDDSSGSWQWITRRDVFAANGVVPGVEGVEVSSFPLPNSRMIGLSLDQRVFRFRAFDDDSRQIYFPRRFGIWDIRDGKLHIYTFDARHISSRYNDVMIRQLVDFVLDPTEIASDSTSSQSDNRGIPPISWISSYLSDGASMVFHQDLFPLYLSPELKDVKVRIDREDAVKLIQVGTTTGGEFAVLLPLAYNQQIAHFEASFWELLITLNFPDQTSVKLPMSKFMNMDDRFSLPGPHAQSGNDSYRLPLLFTEAENIRMLSDNQRGVITDRDAPLFKLGNELLDNGFSMSRISEYDLLAPFSNSSSYVKAEFDPLRRKSDLRYAGDGNPSVFFSGYYTVNSAGNRLTVYHPVIMNADSAPVYDIVPGRNYIFKNFELPSWDLIMIERRVDTRDPFIYRIRNVPQKENVDFHGTEVRQISGSAGISVAANTNLRPEPNLHAGRYVFRTSSGLSRSEKSATYRFLNELPLNELNLSIVAETVESFQIGEQNGPWVLIQMRITRPELVEAGLGEIAVDRVIQDEQGTETLQPTDMILEAAENSDNQTGAVSFYFWVYRPLISTPDM